MKVYGFATKDMSGELVYFPRKKDADGYAMRADAPVFAAVLEVGAQVSPPPKAVRLERTEEGHRDFLRLIRGGKS